MNYATHYDRLIVRARNRALTGCFERHHVVPRCQGGSNSPRNIVYLTPEEHYFAHQLLAKIHPGSRKLLSAAVLMAQRCTGNKVHGWLRRRKADLQRGRRLSMECREKIAAALRGRVFSPEHRARLVATQVRKRPPISVKHKTAISKANRGVPKSAEHRAKIGAARLGKHIGVGRVHSPEHRAKISSALRGNRNGVGRKHSPETIAKIRAARLAYYARQADISLLERGP